MKGKGKKMREWEGRRIVIEEREGESVEEEGTKKKREEH